MMFPTIETISDKVDASLAAGAIDNEGIAEALHALVDQAKAKIDQGNVKAATNVLNAFINHVNAQSSKHISTEVAQALIDSAQTVIDNL